MSPQTAKYLKDHYLNYYRKLDHCRLEEMDIKKYNYGAYQHIHFSFDRSTSNLIITGDFGNAIFSWYTNGNSLSMINDYIKDDPDYFASKCLTSDRPCYIYDQDLAYKEIIDWLYEYNAQNLNWDDDELYLYGDPKYFAKQLVKHIDGEKGFTLHDPTRFSYSDDDDDDLKTALEYIDPDWGESSYYWGRMINPIVEVWSHALNLGFRWYKQQLKKNNNRKE